MIANGRSRTPAANLEQRCHDLEEERKSLLGKIARIEAECDMYRRSLGALMSEQIEINESELLAQVGQGQSLDELMAELDSPRS